MPELAERLEFREAKQAERIPVQRLPLECADHQRACEALADPRSLGQVEITTTGPWDRPESGELLFVGLPQVVAAQGTGVVKAAQNDDSACADCCCRPPR